jgi:hypothetical protein
MNRETMWAIGLRTLGKLAASVLTAGFVVQIASIDAKVTILSDHETLAMNPEVVSDSDRLLMISTWSALLSNRPRDSSSRQIRKYRSQTDLQEKKDENRIHNVKTAWISSY